MAKSIILLLNITGLIFLELFYGENVTVKQNVPSSLELNIGDTISVSISKGELSGFAKLQQEMPKGITAEIINSKGGTFSFKDNILKIIWINLPAEETFSVKYLITTVSTEQEAFTLNGKFSYIEQNERQNIDFESTEIAIASSQIANNKEITENKKAETEISNPGRELVAEGDDFIIYRKVSKIQGKEQIKVDLTIEKEEINSFCKVEEFIPLGYNAIESNSSKGFFSFKDNVVKILWMAFPFGDEITISYILERNNTSDEVNQINGKFSYLKNEETFEFEINKSTIPSLEFEEPSEGIVEKTTETLEESTAVIKEPIREEEETSKEEKINTMEEIAKTDVSNNEKPIIENDLQTSSTSSSEVLANKISNVPTPETGISYKVQIAAGKKEVTKDYFKVKHQINEEVNIEFHEGWRKYTIGRFPIYKTARDKRNNIWEADNKISDAFVTAYNKGNRITVQEALMISNQQWFK